MGPPVAPGICSRGEREQQQQDGAGKGGERLTDGMAPAWDTARSEGAQAGAVGGRLLVTVCCSLGTAGPSTSIPPLQPALWTGTRGLRALLLPSSAKQLPWVTFWPHTIISPQPLIWAYCGFGDRELQWFSWLLAQDQQR